MAEKLLNTRIQLKYDTWDNWDSNKTKQLKRGEVAIVEIPSEVQIKADGTKVQTAPTVLFKVGDGTTTFENLPWASALAADVHTWAKKSEENFLTWMKDQLQTGDIAYVTVGDFDTYKAEQANLIGTADDASTANTIYGAIAKAKEEASKAGTDAATAVAEDLSTHVNTFTEFKNNDYDEFKDDVNAFIADVPETYLKIDDFVVDTALSETSTNPVQNKVVMAALKEKADSTSVYTKGETDGLVNGVKTLITGTDGVNSRLDALEAFNEETLPTDYVTQNEFREHKTSVIGTVSDNLTAATVFGKIKELADEKADKATTLGGYGIADAYTKTEVDDAITNEIKTIEDQLSVVNGDKDTSGSIAEAKAAADAAQNTANDAMDAINGFLTVAETDNGIVDTLKEIQNYIDTDGEAADEMIKDIGKNAQDIVDLDERVDQIESTLDGAELTDTTYTFEDIEDGADVGTFKVTPEGGQTQIVDTGAKKYTDDTVAIAVGRASEGNTAATGIHAVIEAGDKAVREEVLGEIDDINSNIDGINQKIERFGEASDTLVFYCGSATEVWE